MNHGAHSHGSTVHEDRWHAGTAGAGHQHAQQDGKRVHLRGPVEQVERFTLAAGGRYTRHEVAGERAHLSETGVGIDVAVLPWLHLGGDLSYGWFDTKIGRADGLMIPHAHVDLHLPIGSSWEVVVGMEVGFPGGEEALVGDHWEWAPHVELRHDRGAWFVETGARLVVVTGVGDDHGHAEGADGAGEGHHEEGEEEHEDEAAHDEHGHAGHGRSEPLDFHEIVDPHGERELHYYGAFGVRLLDERLTLESRLSGVRVLSRDTEDRNFLRTGVRASWALNERVTLHAEGSVPITDAERNRWQTSVAVRVGF